MNTQIDERDWLMHRLLQEAIGGESVPDLTEGILRRTIDK